MGSISKFVISMNILAEEVEWDELKTSDFLRDPKTGLNLTYSPPICANALDSINRFWGNGRVHELMQMAALLG